MPWLPFIFFYIQTVASPSAVAGTRLCRAKDSMSYKIESGRQWIVHNIKIVSNTSWQVNRPWQHHLGFLRSPSEEVGECTQVGASPRRSSLPENQNTLPGTRPQQIQITNQEPKCEQVKHTWSSNVAAMDDHPLSERRCTVRQMCFEMKVWARARHNNARSL